ncbi:MAG: phosphoribosylanthranilate isomerase [Butyricicoccaceae bacterium]
MKLKFCGLTRIEDIEAANETRPDYIGFVFADSRRHVSDLDAARLKEHLDPEIKTVGVFVNDEPEHIAALVKDEVIDLIQLHGDENEHYIKKLRRLTNAPIIYAVRVETHRDIEEADQLPVDYLLLDTCVKHASRRQRKDLRLVADWGDQPPVFPRRGLNEENITRAAQTGAYALDLSSGIETDDTKDINKMRRVAALVKGAHQ